MDLNIRYLLLTYKQKQMGRYLDVVHSSLDVHQQRFIESVEEMADGLTEDEKYELYEHYQDDYIEVSGDFPRQLYSNFVVSWYSVVEQELFNVCDDLNLKMTITVRDSENLGKGINRAHRFLHNAANYEIERSHWQELTNIRQVRNWIVHRGTLIPYSYFERADDKSKTVPIELDSGNTVYLQIDPNLHRYLESHGAIEYSGLFHLSPSYEYCKHLVEFGREFFSKIYTDLGLRRRPSTKANRA